MADDRTDDAQGAYERRNPRGSERYPPRCSAHAGDHRPRQVGHPRNAAEGIARPACRRSQPGFGYGRPTVSVERAAEWQMLEFLKFGMGPIIAIVAVLASLYYFIHNKKRKKISLEVRTQALMQPAARKHDDNLRMTFNDTLVTDPHIVEITIRNTGHKDVSSKDFDGDDPVTFTVSAPIVADLPNSDLPSKIVTDKEAGKILVHPRKIAVREEIQTRFLVDGVPKIELENSPLLDTDITDARNERIGGILQIFTESLRTIGDALIGGIGGGFSASVVEVLIGRKRG
ncbi:hypothetical protein TSOC111612_06385 [Tsukamurella ocularis]